MTRFLARRLLNYIVLLVLASFLTFSADVAAFTAARKPRVTQSPATPADIDAKAAELNLDKPIPLRYVQWASGAMRGDFGTTVAGQPVVRGTVAPDRREPAAGGHRLGARHRSSVW